ncbi:hypothetical protein TSUD_00500 [Trifolium subterraneum]|nr:hypothetical protein TSUD_00500 [Trifolium subterraneum]
MVDGDTQRKNKAPPDLHLPPSQPNLSYYDKLLTEAPKYKFITPSIFCDRLREIRRRGLKVAVVGIPKSIDNDIPVRMLEFEKEYNKGDEIAWYVDGDKIVRNEQLWSITMGTSSENTAGGGRGIAIPKEVDYTNYLCTYSFLYHQKEMLSYRVRMDAYFNAVFENRHHFKDKVIFLLLSTSTMFGYNYN